jgi:hypothetical protein
MPEIKTMKLVCYVNDALRIIAASSNLDQCASALRSLPGVGNKFLFFASLPSNPTLVDFDLHADWAGKGNAVTSVVADNRAMIQAMLDDPPTDALTFA